MGEAKAAYLSDTVTHSPAVRADADAEPVHAAVALRAKILLHLLFTDRLVVGDAQALTNTTLRALLWPAEACGACPADLGELVAAGALRVAMRDSQESLGALRDWQAEHEVESTPSPAFAAFLDEATEGHLLGYDSTDVSEKFRLGTVDQLTDLAEASPRAEARTVLEVRDWAREQKTLLFNDFRKWRRDRPEKRVLDRVDGFMAIAYTLALPRALALDYVGPADRRSPFAVVKLAERDGYPLGDYGIAETDPGGHDCYCIDTTVLAALPAGFVLDAMQMPQRAKLLAELRRPREGKVLDWDRVVDAFEDLMDALNAATILHLRRDHEGALARLTAEPPQWRLRLSRSFVAQNATDVALSVVTGGASGGLEVLARLVLFGAAVLSESAANAHAAEQEWAHGQDRQGLRLLSSTAPGERLVRTPSTALRRFDASPETLATGNA
jgi:hypothetical protein